MKALYKHLRPVLLIWMLLMLAGVGTAQAQFRYKWIEVGDYQDQYSDAGIRVQEGGMVWPARERDAIHDSFEGPALWIAAKNAPNGFVDQAGHQTALRITHAGPYQYSGDARVQFFPVRSALVGRFEVPEVYVEDALSFRHFTELDSIAPDIDAVQKYVSVTNNTVGITVTQEAYAFSQEYHDDYHIVEYEFRNTGNLDDDPEAELPDQTLHDVYFYFFRRPLPSGEYPASAVAEAAGWGKYTMNDVVGDGMQEYDVDFRAQYSWLGYVPEQDLLNTIGAPIVDPVDWGVEADTTGRLAGADFHGQVVLHADEYAHAPDATAPDDFSQPSTTGHFDNDHPLKFALSDLDEASMLRQYKELITVGHLYPHHADLVDPDGNFADQSGDPSYGTEGGWGYHMAFGPYTMEPGQVVRIVLANGASGLSNDAKVAIGKAYKASDFDDEALIAYDPVSGEPCTPGESATCAEMTKNEWVMTSKDSLFQTFQRAIANFESGFQIPKAPLPPRRFEVTGMAEEIRLEWETYSGATPAAFEIWRAQNYWDYPPAWDYVATVPGDVRQWSDTPETGIFPGLEYYYYLVAVGDVNEDPTGLTPTGVPLKSNPTLAITYLPVSLKRPPPENPMVEARIVPNPFNLAQDSNIRWPGTRDRLGFLDIPGQCTIRIYTQTGELVKVIEHTDGSGNEYWNMTTDSRQMIASGLYVALIIDGETGDRIMRKFIVIR